MNNNHLATRSITQAQWKQAHTMEISQQQKTPLLHRFYINLCVFHTPRKRHTCCALYISHFNTNPASPAASPTPRGPRSPPGGPLPGPRATPHAAKATRCGGAGTRWLAAHWSAGFGCGTPPAQPVVKYVVCTAIVGGAHSSSNNTLQTNACLARLQFTNTATTTVTHSLHLHRR